MHGVLDYVTVALFLAAPSIFHLSGTPSGISYSLGGIHLALTLLTAFPLGLLKIVPMVAHGALELVVSLTLIPLPWILGFASDLTARWFYTGAGVVILAISVLTDYRGLRKAAC
jgi:hypothetical protein